MGDNSSPEQVTVLVTGFGPFAMHSVNASWMAVAELSKTGLGEEAANVNLVTKEIQVEYQTVSELVPILWETHKPQLMVHVGVSGITKHLTMEQQAFNVGYNKGDICGCIPDEECCIVGADECISSGIDMASVCDYVNKSQCSVKAVVSTDPGRARLKTSLIEMHLLDFSRYLCDFIYFTSLSIDRNRTAFIHVPPLEKPYSVGQLAEGIRLAIIAMLKQLKLL